MVWFWIFSIASARRLRGGGVSQAPAGHRVGLGKAVHRDGEVVKFLAERGDGNVLGLAVDELFVNLVGKDDDVLAEGDFTEFEEFVPGVNGTGRIAREC